MRALTVQQPWAWAIIHGGKDIENRTQAWSYRGPLAIHAGGRISERGMTSHLVGHSLGQHSEVVLRRGAILGVVDLVDVHQAMHLTECCESPWAESSYAEHGGRNRSEIVHMILENPRPLDEPIPCAGRLGLWTPSAEVLEQLEVALP